MLLVHRHSEVCGGGVPLSCLAAGCMSLHLLPHVCPPADRHEVKHHFLMSQESTGPESFSSENVLKLIE